MASPISDLRPLVESEGPFVTMLLPAPSRFDDGAHRFDIVCKNALKEVPSDWPEARVAEIEATLASIPHDAGDAVMLVAGLSGDPFVEFLGNATSGGVYVGPLPRLAPLIESRQRVVNHVVVETDLAGADIVAFESGVVVATDEVEGDTEHIHRGRFGGWSHRRFQQRAENTWHENARDVAAAVEAVAKRTEAELITISGPTRAQSMLVAELEDFPVRVVALEAGDTDGIAAETLRLTADVAARATRDIIERAAESRGTVDGAFDLVEALRAGRVETLLVHDDGSDDVERVNEYIKHALLTHAAVRVVPHVSVLENGGAAILRW